MCEVIDADQWPDDTVLLDLNRRAVCTKCGMIGADVRPNWSERPPPESLTGAQPPGRAAHRHDPECARVGSWAFAR
jgi:hypothetical protein